VKISSELKQPRSSCSSETVFYTISFASKGGKISGNARQPWVSGALE